MAFEKQYAVDPEDFSIFGYKLSATLNTFLVSIHREGYTEGQAQDKVDPVFSDLSGLVIRAETLEGLSQTLQAKMTDLYEDEDLL